jgi:hypothetical protein
MGRTGPVAATVPVRFRVQRSLKAQSGAESSNRSEIAVAIRLQRRGD